MRNQNHILLLLFVLCLFGSMSLYAAVEVSVTIDDFTGDTETQLRVLSVNENATFVIQCTSIDDLAIAVYVHNNIIDGSYVHFKFNDNDPEFVTVSPSIDHRAQIFTRLGKNIWISELLDVMKSNHTIIMKTQVGIYVDNPITSVFPLQGLTKALVTLKTNCIKKIPQFLTLEHKWVLKLLK